VRRLLLLAVVAGAAVACLAPAAAARVSYCSPTGDYCTSVARVQGIRYLRLTTFAFSGRVRICVRDPRGGRVCHGFRLQKAGPTYLVSIRWRRHYPVRGPGTYRVSFYLGTTRLGPVLAFVRR
jgi:hypothetical protein